MIMIAVLLVGCASPPRPRLPTADPADVGSIEGLVRGSYQVISGSAGQPRQWERDRTFYAPGATFVSVWEDKGQIKTKVMTPEQFRRDFKIGEGFDEYEVGRRIERFGNVAQVRSVAELRTPVGGPVTERFVNYFNFFWDGTRWWIAGMVWQKEGPSTQIPSAWIGIYEEVLQ
jgi:hypothetical protein